MKSRRTYGRYIAIGLVIVIALICVWALVFTREVSFADAADVDTVDFTSMELVSEDSGETIELDAAQRGASPSPAPCDGLPAASRRPRPAFPPCRAGDARLG